MASCWGIMVAWRWANRSARGKSEVFDLQTGFSLSKQEKCCHSTIIVLGVSPSCPLNQQNLGLGSL